MEDQSHEFFKRLDIKRVCLLQKDCDFLSRILSDEWEKLRDVDRLAVIRIMFEKKHCSIEQIMPYLFKLMNSIDPYYRYEGLNYIVELDGKNQREFLVRVFNNDPDLVIRNRALLLLADIHRSQRDMEILRFALSAFEDPTSAIESRLIAGAAMMFLLDIPSDEDGRPAFWDEDEEELNHPAIQRAVAETRKILTNAT